MSYDPRSRVYLVQVYVREVSRMGTMTFGHGFDDRGVYVSFVGDPRALAHIEAELAAGEPVTATVPAWAIFAGPPA